MYKNITIALPEHVWRKARELAAKRGKSLSALIREQLEALTQEKMNLISRHQFQKLLYRNNRHRRIC